MKLSIFQDKPYETWFREDKRMKFKSLAQAILLWSSLYQQLVKKRKVCTVFYLSETGCRVVQYDLYDKALGT